MKQDKLKEIYSRPEKEPFERLNALMDNAIEKLTPSTGLINWSEVSRLLTDDRTHIRASYSGKKYARQINGLKRLIEFWIKWIK